LKEVESLLDRARVYLSSARLLREAGDYESAVSRGYYAMFYAAEAALLVRGVAASSHKGVIAEFNRLYTKAGSVSMELARALGQAFEKRQLGDYEFRRVITAEEASEIERNAKAFVDRVSALLGRDADEGQASLPTGDL
jgi:uncharacterized protein (UPF0332 family)